MAAQKGRLILIKIGDGTTPTENFTTLGGIRSKTITINNEQIDVTSDDTSGWRELFPDAGISSISVSGSGILKTGDDLTDAHDAAVNKTLINCQIIVPGMAEYVGPFQITNFQVGGEYNQPGTFSISLESGGDIEVTTLT